MEIISEIEFKNPELFFLLIFPILHALWFFIGKKNTDTLVYFSNVKLFHNKKSFKEKIVNLPYILKLISMCFIIISLCRPQTKNSWIENKTEGIDIIIALDVSGSMLAQDLSPSRLEASKKIAIDFIKNRINDRIGIVVFSGESFTQCPITSDKTSLINLFNDIQYGLIDDGTAIGEGLGNSINRLINSESKSKVVILLTDGENNKGKISPLTAAEIAASDSVQVKVYTIGVGSKGMAKSPVAIDPSTNKFIYDYVEVKIDEKTLTDIAEMTGGQYFRATDNNSLKEIYSEINDLERTKLDSITFNTKNEEFWKFSLIALFLYVLSFVLKISYFKKIS